MLLNYIDLRIFMVSLAVGLFFVYILGPETKTVYVYPSPENITKILFRDKAEQCFDLKPQEVQCPNDSSLFASIPVQT